MEKYQLIKVLGEGSFGCAHLVRRKSDNLYFVIKEIRFSTLKPKEREDAQNEIAILSKLDCPYIISYIESFFSEGKLCIVMEYADGGDLATKITAQGRKHFSEDEILHIFTQLCLAIKYIHDRRILHRDLKCGNVFLTSKGDVKLGDFGIAKVMSNSVQLAQTQIGTPYYLSPEICEGRRYNSKTDIWSLGCVLYEMCTLRHAFNANNMNALIANIIRGRYSPIPSHYSRDMRELISEMLNKDFSRRPSIIAILHKNFIRRRLEQMDDDLSSSNTGSVEQRRCSLNKSRSGLSVQKSQIAEQKKQVDKEEVRKQREENEAEMLRKLENGQNEYLKYVQRRSLEGNVDDNKRMSPNPNQKPPQEDMSRSDIRFQPNHNDMRRGRRRRRESRQRGLIPNDPYCRTPFDDQAYMNYREAYENKRRVIQQEFNSPNPFLPDSPERRGPAMPGGNDRGVKDGFVPERVNMQPEWAQRNPQYAHRYPNNQGMQPVNQRVSYNYGAKVNDPFLDNRYRQQYDRNYRCGPPARPVVPAPNLHPDRNRYNVNSQERPDARGRYPDVYRDIDLYDMYSDYSYYESNSGTNGIGRSASPDRSYSDISERPNEPDLNEIDLAERKRIYENNMKESEKNKQKVLQDLVGIEDKREGGPRRVRPERMYDPEASDDAINIKRIQRKSPGGRPNDKVRPAGSDSPGGQVRSSPNHPQRRVSDHNRSRSPLPRRMTTGPVTRVPSRGNPGRNPGAPRSESPSGFQYFPRGRVGYATSRARAPSPGIEDDLFSRVSLPPNPRKRRYSSRSSPRSRGPRNRTAMNCNISLVDVNRRREGNSAVDIRADIIRSALNDRVTEHDDTFSDQDDGSSEVITRENKQYELPKFSGDESIFYRSEAIRAFLEEQIGIDNLVRITDYYTNLKDDASDCKEPPFNFDPQIMNYAQQLVALEERMDSMS